MEQSRNLFRDVKGTAGWPADGRLLYKNQKALHIPMLERLSSSDPNFVIGWLP
jgi:hypothetical protein